MKKIGTINQPLSEVLAGLGHQDSLVVADAGLPIPDSTRRIDLALTEGTPGFLETVKVILEEIKVERFIVAEEMQTVSPEVYKQILDIMEDVAVDTIPHEQFKERTRTSRAIVRTGEFTPYANVILVSGVVF